MRIDKTNIKGVKVVIIFKNLNLGIRFLLELIVLGSVGYLGFKINLSITFKVCLGIGLPFIIAIIWGTFGSPKATYPLIKPLKWVLLFSIYLFSAFALFNSVKKFVAIIFVLTAAVNSIFIYIWDLESKVN